MQEIFESDSEAAISRAAAWLLLKGSDVELDTIVGDRNQVSVFYSEATKQAEPPATPATGVLKVVRGPATTPDWSTVVSGKAG
jgi:hypothetical protein